MSNLDNVRGKRVLVVGFGKSGQAAADAMLRLGADVTVQDAKNENELDANLVTFFRNRNVRFYFHSLPEDMSAFDLLILSPGASPELGFVQEAKAKGAEISGELEIAYRITKGNYIAITGTNGKTTTTTLVGEIMKNSGRKTYVVGNIGVAVISESAVAKEGDWLVTETSSFQLETIKYFKPKVSAILNITPDHLNRHHTMEAYAAAKAKVFENQRADGFLIANLDDELVRKTVRTAQARILWFSTKDEPENGAFLRGDELLLRMDGVTEVICRKDELKIIGEHNIQNALAAAAITYAAGVDMKVITDTIKAFTGVEHRIEFCAEIDGVRYYNDSKGTNTDAVEIALKALKENIILIAGGDAKGQDFSEFAKKLNGPVKKLILFGRDAYMIKDAALAAGFTDIIECRNMDDCVKKAFEISVPGDSVLLSPACASWDMYDNYEQRGRHFKDCVWRLESL